jgi:hypothetical protein
MPPTLGGDGLETKTGTQTTEFWLTIVGMLINGILMAMKVMPIEIGAPLLTGGGAVYALSRGVAKHNVKP